MTRTPMDGVQRSPLSLPRTRSASPCLLLAILAGTTALAQAPVQPGPADAAAAAGSGTQGSTGTATGVLVPLDVVRPELGGINDTLNDFVQFGYSVAIEGDRLLVGVPFRRDDAGLQRGAVYFYQGVEPNRWQQRQRILFGSGGSAQCGVSVALGGRHAMIGCPSHTQGGLSDRGRTTFYERDPVTGMYGNPQSVLGDGADQRCGTSVAIHGTGEVNSTWAVSGCPGGDGTADVFQRVQTLDGETWLRVQTLANPAPADPGGKFGASVALYRAASGGVRIAVGASDHGHGGQASFGGIAYVFRRDGGGGLLALEATRTRPGGPQAFDNCGASVALGPNDWFVGCPRTSEGGRVLAFHFNGSSWNSGVGFPAPAGLGDLNSSFGAAVATSRSGTPGDLWVGQQAASSDLGVVRGRLLRLQRTGGPPSPVPLAYVPVAHWDAGTLGIDDDYARLGWSVAVDNEAGVAAVGAPGVRIPEPWGEVIVFGPDRIFANGLGCGAGLPGC